MANDDIDYFFANLVDELKQEVGCIASFLTAGDIRLFINATKTTGPGLTADRYFVLADDAITTGDRASALGFLMMSLVTEAIERESEAIDSSIVPEDGYDPVTNKLFKGR